MDRFLRAGRRIFPGAYRMTGQLCLPFLAPEVWRVVVIGPTGRYARNQVAGMIEAGTPLVGGIALGRGGEAMRSVAAL